MAPIRRLRGADQRGTVLAHSSSMPRAAIDAGVVDHIVPLDDLAARLQQL
jgi:chemotaxis response regulator CheB